MRQLTILFALSFAIGCLDEGAYQCETSAECTNGGVQGTCEANGYCSFPDEDCESGRRFGGSAAGDVAGECVTDAAISCAGEVQLEAGDRHTCALIGGVVRCWGSNVFGQLGDGTVLASSVPVEVAGLRNVTKLTAGVNHSCALTEEGVVYCWGANNDGELGLPPGTQPVTLPAVAMTGAVDVSAGDSHTCALKSDGSAWCWGRNDQGQLGDDTQNNSYRPVRAEGLEGASAITAGFNHTCALKDGSVWCWGDDDRSQIGDADEGDKHAPVEIGLTDVVTLDAGGDHTCAVTSANQVLCWGFNNSGQIGNGTNATQLIPQLLYGVKADLISARANHTCVYTNESSEMRCWGRNDYGQLGDGLREDSPLWKLVSGVSGPVTALAAGQLHSCVYVDGSGVTCWGRNDFGQLGLGDTLRSAVAVDVPGVTAESGVASGTNHSCALDTAGTVRCWGRNSDGYLGVEPPAEEIPAEMLGPISVAVTGGQAIYGGEGRTCVKTGATMLCWGSDGDGLLGDGTTGTTLTPTAITEAVATPSSISLGDNHTCAVDGAGAVYCWGNNGSGALGIDGGSSSTAQIATAAPAVADEVSVGDSHSCARAAGAVTCWGNNDSGQLGDNTQTTPAAGTAVSAVLPAAALDLASGNAHNCAVVEGGGVFCWGANNRGQLGLPLAGDVVSGPAQVTLPAAATAVFASENTTCALLSDSRVFCWGSNQFQQLGLDLDIPWSATPTEIPELLAATIGMSGTHICVTTTDGVAQCWGDNAYTQLGGDRVPLSTTPTPSELQCF